MENSNQQKRPTYNKLFIKKMNQDILIIYKLLLCCFVVCHKAMFIYEQSYETFLYFWWFDFLEGHSHSAMGLEWTGWKKVEKSTLNSTLQSLFLISKQPSRRGETDRPCHICLVARSINHTFPLHSTLDRITFRPQKKNPASNFSFLISLGDQEFPQGLQKKHSIYIYGLYYTLIIYTGDY